MTPLEVCDPPYHRLDCGGRCRQPINQPRSTYPMRSFSIETLEGTDLDDAVIASGEWAAVIGDRHPITGTFCEFGLAEEVIGLIAFDDGTFEVGQGEALRPYRRAYTGNTERYAVMAFFIVVTAALT